MNSVTIRSHKTFLPADYIGTLGGGLLPEMFYPIHQYDTPEHHVIELAVPGMTSHDIRVELKNPVLWIRAQHTVKDPISGKREVRGLPYQRSFIVPRNCEAGAIDAKCREGLLAVRIKKHQARKPIRISITRKSIGIWSWLRRVQQKAARFFN
jgi:HSP20 family molecular chaperone IbpA